MKKTLALVLTACSLFALLACGSADKSKDKDKNVDLTAFYTKLESEYELGAMTDVTDDLATNYYPGLDGYEFTQKVMKMPMMSSVVSEYALLECKNESDAEAVGKILQKRIDDQANGGAWYPDSMEAWKNAKVIINGKYVAMIAGGENQAAMEKAYNEQF